MSSSINPMPIFTYIKTPSIENTQAAIEFLQTNTKRLISITKIAKIVFFIFGACSLITFLLSSRIAILDEERKISDNDSPSISIIHLLSRFFFCLTLLTGFFYLNCKGGVHLTTHAIAWIQSY